MKLLRKKRELDDLGKEKNFAIPSNFNKALRRVTNAGIKSAKKYVREFDKTDYNNLKTVKETFIQEDPETGKRTTVITKKTFSSGAREKVPERILEKAKKSGVIQKDTKGNWRIISLKSGEFWDAKYSSREKAESALAAYHANK